MKDESVRDENQHADETDTDAAGTDENSDTGVRETGDISGATSTHAGAGGNFGNTGGTGTAPTE